MANEPYRGSTRRLVISFDVGTTFSGISYCILDPGEVARICSVTRFPGQEHNASSSKIPTVLYYDQSSKVKAVGAETELDHIVEQAEDEEWLKVQWFKLRLRPRSMSSSVPIKQITPLPASKTATNVLADFLHYLMSCAKTFITDTHPTMTQSWDELISTASFVLSHPNGWEGAQQARYRKACIQAGIVPDTMEGKSKIVFVTEGEASLNYCLRGDYIDKLNTKSGFIVADMGGGTLDFSAYKMVGLQPLRVEEMAAARCELQGSTLVTERAKQYIQDKLQKSEKYGDKGVIEAITNVFDRTTKRIYRGFMDAMCYITFGLHSDKDIANDIRAGRLKLKSEQVAGFFDPSINAALDAIEAQTRDAPIPVSAVYLVGGFAANQYLVSELRRHLRNKGISVHCPDGQTIKAVADGSISFFIDHFVTTRISKWHYLMDIGVDYNPNLEDHRKRAHRVVTRPSGRNIVCGSVDVILHKGTSVKSETEYRKLYCKERELHGIEPNEIMNDYVLSYVGPEPVPKWMDEKAASYFKTVCTVSVPIKDLKFAAQNGVNAEGKPYVVHNYSVILHFGGPEIKAQLCWQGKSGEERSPAEIIYEDVDDDYDSDEVEDDLCEDGLYAEFRTQDVGDTE